MHSGLPPLDEVQVVPLVQHRKRKCALHLFRHVFQAVQMEGSFLFYQLYRDVAVCLDSGPGQTVSPTQLHIILEHAVVCQCKGCPSCISVKGVIVAVTLLTALGCQARVAHHGVDTSGNPEPHPVGRQGALIDVKPSATVVGDAGGVRSPYLALGGQDRQKTVLFSGAELMSIVQHTEQAAHYSSTSLSTGSFT